MTTNAQAKLAARYGAPTISALQQWNDTIDQLLEHRSVRAFTDQPLPEGTLETLVAAAQSASTSSNLQVWSVVAVQEGDRKGRLSALAGNQPYIHQAPLFLVWLADLSRVSRIADQHGVELEALPYLESLLLGTIDAALAAQNAVVALVKPRLPQAAVLHHETYSAADEQGVLAEYDKRLGAFYQREGMKASGWSEQVVSRLRNVSSLHGREELLGELSRMGFGLR